MMKMITEGDSIKVVWKSGVEHLRVEKIAVDNRGATTLIVEHEDQEAKFDPSEGIIPIR